MINYFNKLYKGVTLVCHQNASKGLAYIKLDNPPVNALSLSVIDSLHEILLHIDRDKDIKLVQIGHEGNHFSAGADLKERSAMSNEESLKFLDKINDCFDLIENLEIPTICYLRGGAVLGGGAELALCCDFIIGDDGSDYRIGFPETSIGIIPGAGGTYRIYKKMNQGIAKYWVLSGKQFSLKEAYDDGFIDLIFPSNDYDEQYDFQNLFLKKSRTSLMAAKKSMNKCYLETDRKKQRLIELEEYKKTLNSPERKEALEKYKKK